jgi:hypothetical protein
VDATAVVLAIRNGSTIAMDHAIATAFKRATAKRDGFANTIYGA